MKQSQGTTQYLDLPTRKEKDKDIQAIEIGQDLHLQGDVGGADQKIHLSIVIEKVGVQVRGEPEAIILMQMKNKQIIIEIKRDQDIQNSRDMQETINHQETMQGLSMQSQEDIYLLDRIWAGKRTILLHSNHQLLSHILHTF